MKKIMFNDRFLLTQAVLDGRKTMTRRKLSMTLDKRVGGNLIRVYPERVFLNDGKWNFDFEGRTYLLPRENYPRYKVGEIVAVAQSYYDAKVVGDTTVDYPLIFDDGDAGYTNKMFVKASLMPHQIRITNVRMERLQEITDDDIMREGIKKGEFYNTWDEYYFYVNEGCFTAKTPREAYAALIDKIGGKGTWDSNPYVFVYDFELVK